MTNTKQWVNEALRTIHTLFEPGDVVEIRALEVDRDPNGRGTSYSGYFNIENCDAIAQAVEKLDSHAEGVYIVLNRLNPALLARANNRLQAKPKTTTSDRDITEWRWLYIDLDPARPAGISATSKEHDAALERAGQVRAFLDSRGWPLPVYGDSSNGAHLLYRLPPLDLERGSQIVKLCLKALAPRFSDAFVKVDESTANASRLCKLYGTMTRKGDSTPDRPHRRSRILNRPGRIEPVPVEALEALAAQGVPSAGPNTGGQTILSGTSGLDIDQWLAKGGLEILKGPESYHGGRRWTLRTCPFNPSHDKPVIIELSGGAIVYKCSHNSCADNDWKALRRQIEPGDLEWAYRPYSPSSATAVASSTVSVPLIKDLAQIPSVFSLQAPLNWCVDSMIAQGSITLICAESGTGKTWVGYYLAGCVAHGVSVLSHPVRACKVLYLDGENPLCVAKQRLFDLGISETPNLTVWGGWNLSPPVGPQDPLVIEFARQHRGLIIYDSLIEFHPGSEQSSTETRAFMRYFRALANLGATLVILHHTGKADTSKLYRGSSDIKAAVDTAYLLVRASQQREELGELSMTCFKARLAPGRNFQMKFKKRVGFIPRDQATPIKTADQIIAEILNEKPNINQTEIVRLGLIAGCPKRQLENCLKCGAWVKSPGPKNSTLYSLPADRSEGDEAGL